MNHSDITRIAKEAGLFVPQAGIPENGALVRFFHAAYVAGAEAEREHCAELIPPQYFELRDRIRSRGMV